MAIIRHPLLSARRNPTMVANPRHGRGGRFVGRHGGKSRGLMHYVRNPAQIEVAGIQVIPAAAGAAVASVVEAIVGAVPTLATLGGPQVSKLIPAVANVAAGFAIHKFLGNKYPIAKTIGGFTAAFGIGFAVKALLGNLIHTSVSQAVSKVSPGVTAPVGLAPVGLAPAGKQAGWAGGGFVPKSAMSGGQFQPYNKPFVPVEGTNYGGMSGFMMGGSLAPNQPPVGLGARMGGLGGIDLNTFAD